MFKRALYQNSYFFSLLLSFQDSKFFPSDVGNEGQFFPINHFKDKYNEHMKKKPPKVLS